jgi:exopolysaccharide biosynthesis polyprenyl glycosylphosphotransferase
MTNRRLFIDVPIEPSLSGESIQTPEKLNLISFPLSQLQRKVLITICLVIGDALFLGIAFALAYLLRFELLPYGSTYSLGEYFQLVVLVIPVWILIFTIIQLYNPTNLFGGVDEYIRVVNGVTIGTMLLIVFGFFQRDEVIISRGWLIISWLFAFLTVSVFRFTFRRLIYSLRKRGHLLSPALIVGANDEGIALAAQLQKWSTSGLYITGFIDQGEPIGSKAFNSYKVLGRLDDIEKILADEHIEEVIVAPTALNRTQLLDIFRTISPMPNTKLRLSSGLFEIISTGLRVKELAFVPLVEVNNTRISGPEALLKFLEDYGLSILILLFIWPILLLIALLIKLDSPGRIIYRRQVMGTNGKVFDAFKFRTMCANGEEILQEYPELKADMERDYKLKDDPRVTRIGYYLRKYSLDELPQFFNVLFGQMSVIGPRMISPPEMGKYGKWGMNLLTVKPGISGLWQVSGRSDVSYEQRVQLDMQYIRNWSIWLDIYLILATPVAIIKRRGAY